MEPNVRTALSLDGERFFGPGPCRLLEGVERLGSLSAVAREMAMSYSKVNRVVKSAEQALGFPLLERRIGGADGGASRLTAQGADLVRRYRAWERVVLAAADEDFLACFEGVAGVSRCGCVVLANGRSERFGSQKLLADLDGRPVLARTLEHLSAAPVDVVVAAAPGPVADLARKLGFETVAPEGPDLSDSMRAGLKWAAGRGGCLFVQGDQPRLATADVAALVGTHQDYPCAVVRLAWQGRPASPVLWPSRLFDALANVSGDRGGSALLKGDDGLVGLQILVEAASEASVTDVDTPDALERLRTMK